MLLVGYFGGLEFGAGDRLARVRFHRCAGIPGVQSEEAVAEDRTLSRTRRAVFNWVLERLATASAEPPPTQMVRQRCRMR